MRVMSGAVTSSSQFFTAWRKLTLAELNSIAMPDDVRVTCVPCSPCAISGICTASSTNLTAISTIAARSA
ncbi:hypothetical protein C7W88_00030 [Novosphingobium sp. THN1]|nr:hypothetical protein C7W88_00030 [Novosphingobium sp. THN1]